MIQEVRTYICDGTPSDEDIKEAIDIVQREGFIIRLRWHVRYSGTYFATVACDSTLESVKAQIPRVYGM